MPIETPCALPMNAAERGALAFLDTHAAELWSALRRKVRPVAADQHDTDLADELFRVMLRLRLLASPSPAAVLR